jgi:hypothetical protein
MYCGADHSEKGEPMGNWKWPIALWIGGLGCHHRQQATVEDSLVKIVGGNEFSSLPAIGVLQSKTMRCTATLISPQRILTAAHCLTRITSPKELTFSIGPSASKPLSSYSVKAMQMHPHYQRKYAIHDIAVADLIEPVPATIQPLHLWPDANGVWQDQRLFVVGYGYSDGLAQKGSGVKRAVWLPVTELASLKILSDPRDGRSTCQGDSGGPALIKGRRGEPEFWVVGVTSAGGDTSCQSTSIFTRTEPYRAFVTGEPGKDPGPLPDPCALLEGATTRCSEDGERPSVSGRYQLSCRVDPWLSRLSRENCQARGAGQWCKEGRCVESNP